MPAVSLACVLLATLAVGSFASNSIIKPFCILKAFQAFSQPGPTAASLIIASLDGKYEYYYFQGSTDSSSVEHPSTSCRRWRGTFLEIENSLEYEILSNFVINEALISSDSYETFLERKKEGGSSCVALKQGPIVQPPSNGCSNQTDFICKVLIADREANFLAPAILL